MNEITAKNIQNLMDATLNKVSIYLQPILLKVTPDVSPTDNEILAAASIIDQFTSFIEDLKNTTQRHTPEDFSNPEWLTQDEWQAFFKTIQRLVHNIQRRRSLSGLDSNMLFTLRTAISDLGELVDELSPLLVESNLNIRKPRSQFLDTLKQRQLMQPAAQNFQIRLIEQADPPLNHKQAIRLYAVMYEVIRQYIGLSKEKFDGAGFDRFLYHHCKIEYNGSDDPKGRYRSVREAWVKLFVDSDEGEKMPAYKEMQRFIGFAERENEQREKEQKQIDNRTISKQLANRHIPFDGDYGAYK